MDVASYKYFSRLFEPLSDDPPGWKRDAILKGSISCAGVGAESLLRASRMALIGTMSRGGINSRANCLSTLTGLMKDMMAKEAETQPLLEVIAYLLSAFPSILPTDYAFR